MNSNYEKFRAKAFSALRGLAKECPEFADAEMIVAASDVTASLKRNTVHKSIDTEWIDKIEAALPAIDIIVRKPAIAIEDVDEILPVELSRHISEKTIKHLAQHTNFILEIKDDGEVIPSKLLNVFHDETVLTYENKFVNTLLARLAAFVDKRFKALNGGAGTERNYKFDYATEFEHFAELAGGKNTARINLSIELTSPLENEVSDEDIDANHRYKDAIARIRKISMAVTSFMSSPFIRSMGRNYIRPPVIRTNAILKNKNLKECLTLWEYIESFEKVGYSFVTDEYAEMPSSDYITDLYSSVALQYTHFYNGVAENAESNRLLSERRLSEVLPEFDTDTNVEDLEDYMVYDSEYKKTVPVSRLMNNRKKLSEDERRIRTAIIVALKADEELNRELLEREAEERRLAREKRLAEEAEARRLAEEEARRRQEEEERLRAEEEEARRRAAKAPVEIRYKRSYLSRLIQAEPPLQDWYNTVKNALLSYDGVKAKTSWKYEAFKRGRTHLARIDVKGKMLYLYLALEPTEYENTKYFTKDVSAKPGFAEVPLLMKIKSERGVNHALELIAAVMEKNSIARIEREDEDFRLPYETTEALIEKGLIKVLTPTGTTLEEGDETVKASLDFLTGEKAEGSEAAEEVPLAEPVPTPSAEPVEIRYKRSYLSRLIQAEAPLGDWYSTVKNALLSHDGVKAKTSWKYESFKCGRTHLARIDVKGKMLYLYLALDPEEYADSKYFIKNVSKKPGFAEVPSLLKIKSERGVNHALELIAAVMEKNSIARIEREDEDFRLPFETTEMLIEKGLIKVLTSTGTTLGEGDETVKASLDFLSGSKSTEEKTAAEAPAEAPTEEAAEPIEADEAPLPVAPVQGTVEVHYKRSYLSRLIQAEAPLQDWYTDIKNALLSFEGVRAKTSWKYESFKCGRTHLARIDVKGKMLYLYLALDPKTYENTKYFIKDVSKKPGFAEVPTLLKIKSERGRTYALELISALSVATSLSMLDREYEDFHLPYETTESLIEQGLIKVLGGEAADGAEIVNANISELLAAIPAKEGEEAETSAIATEITEPDTPDESPDSETDALAEAPAEVPVEEAAEEAAEAPVEAAADAPIEEPVLAEEPEAAEAPIEEPVLAEEPEAAEADVEEPVLAEEPEAAEADVEEPVLAEENEGEQTPEAEPEEIEDEDEEQLIVASGDGAPVAVRYRRSFLSRLIQANPEVQDNYTDFKNALLSYRGVKNRISWRFETFRRGRAPLARLNVRGKTLYVYLAIEPSELENTKYRFRDVSDKVTYAGTPTLLRITGSRSRKHAFELIERIMNEKGISQTERTPEDYHLPYETTEALIERDLIKLVLPEGVSYEQVKEALLSKQADVTVEEPTEVIEDSSETAEETPVDEAPETVEEMSGTVEDSSETAEETPVDEAPETVEEEEISDEKLIEIIESVADTDVTDDQLEEILARESTVEAPTESTASADTAFAAYVSTPLVKRRVNIGKRVKFICTDSEISPKGAIIIPYTRAQYLALPRKKKKSVLTNVNRLLDYRRTLALLDTLKSLNSSNERILERIANLEIKVAEKRKFIPTAKLWEACIPRK